MAEESKTLWVRSNRNDNRVVLYEVDPAHPGGEALVFRDGDRAFEVGETPEVQRLLHEKQLVKVPAAEVKKQQAAEETK